MDKILYYIEDVKKLIETLPTEKKDQNLIQDFERFLKIFWNYYNNEYQNEVKFNDYYKVSDIDILKIKLYTIRDQVLEILNE